jgi:hypothetical protein
MICLLAHNPADGWRLMTRLRQGYGGQVGEAG